MEEKEVKELDYPQKWIFSDKLRINYCSKIKEQCQGDVN